MRACACIAIAIRSALPSSGATAPTPLWRCLARGGCTAGQGCLYIYIYIYSTKYIYTQSPDAAAGCQFPNSWRWIPKRVITCQTMTGTCLITENSYACCSFYRPHKVWPKPYLGEALAVLGEGSHLCAPFGFDLRSA